MSASIYDKSEEKGFYSFTPVFDYLSKHEDKYAKCYMAVQTIKKLVDNKMLKIESPEQLIEIIETLMNEA